MQRAQALVAPAVVELLKLNEKLVGSIECTPQLGDFVATFRPTDA